MSEPTTVTATFSRTDGSDAVERTVTLVLRGTYVWMVGGPTGYESLPADAVGDFTGPDARDWYACAGTDGRWLRCVVPASEMARAMRELVPMP